MITKGFSKGKPFVRLKKLTKAQFGENHKKTLLKQTPKESTPSEATKKTVLKQTPKKSTLAG